MNRQHSNPQTVKPSEIVEKFFSGSRQELLEVLVGTKRESLLERFVRENLRGLSFTKVRRYYEQFLNIYEEAMEEKNFKKDPLPEEILVKLYLLKSHVVYDQAREKKLGYFKDFLSALILKVNTFEELEKAKRFFEALIGYARAYLRNK